MDLSKLSLSELRDYQKQLEAQLRKSTPKEMAIAEAMKAEPMQPPARMMRRLQEAVAQIPRSENAPGTGKSRTMIEMLNKMTPEARADVIARPDAMRNIEASIAKAAPMETPYGKSFLSYTPEGKIAGKTGAALRGLGKLAKAIPYVSGAGAALAAIDLGQALSEVQDKGAAKIAADYKKEQEDKILGQSEDMGGGDFEKARIIERLDQAEQRRMEAPTKSYSPEERMKLKEMLNKLRSGPSLRGSVSKSDYPTYKTNYDSVRDYLKNAIPQDGKEFDGQESYDNIKRV